MLKVLSCLKKVNHMNRGICGSRILYNEDQGNRKESKRKVKETVELITLVDQNDTILGIKPRKESELLANKLNLSLERVTDPKYGSKYPAYKMFSTADLLKIEKKTTTSKVLKKLPINSRIAEHDLSLKVNIIRKWLAKNCEVHIAIVRNNETETTMKNVLSKIQEQLMNEARILDIRHKEESIKFIVLPPKETSNKGTAKSNDKKENSKEES